MFRRRVHIAGSISSCQKVASAEAVNKARSFVEGLVKELIRRGASFVLPVDDEKTRPDDGLPFCFDWLVWKTLYENRDQRPPEAEEKYVVAIQHHKSKDQIPEEYKPIWEGMSDVVRIHHVGRWNMGAKRLEAQASEGDVLLLLGGEDGVLHLANLYRDVGKPVIPLPFEIVDKDAGARKLFADVGLSKFNSAKLFSTNMEKRTPHEWMGGLDKGNELQVENLLELLDNLLPPDAFVIRLLDPEDKNYEEVDRYHNEVLKPLVEDEYGFRLVTIDEQHSYETPRIDQEIFEKLHRSQVVLADLTSFRANCLVEVGYALGRGLPTLLLAKERVDLPFDLKMRPALFRQESQTVEEKQDKFRNHWRRNLKLPPLVPREDLCLPGSNQARNGDVFSEYAPRPGDSCGKATRDLATEQPMRLSDQQSRIVAACVSPRSLTELMTQAGVTHRSFFRNRHLKPLLDAGIIRMTNPVNPNAANQRYILTKAGQNLRASQELEPIRASHSRSSPRRTPTEATNERDRSLLPSPEDAVVIQCAAGKNRPASKDPNAGYLATANGKPVLFVADPADETAPWRPEVEYRRPDDIAPSGLSWRDELIKYNKIYRDTGANPLGLLPAWRLYKDSAYEYLVNQLGEDKVFILSAGWGLIPAPFLTPDYDITFSGNAEAYKRRRKQDRYADFSMLPKDASHPIHFLGGKDYVSLFLRLTAGTGAERVIHYVGDYPPPPEPNCRVRRFETTRRTNWHYECAMTLW